MPRFFVEPGSVQDGRVRLNEKESRHAVAVLRLKSGDAVELFDGSGRSFSGVVTGMDAGRLSVAVNQNRHPSRPSPVAVTLGVSVIKPERMEFLIQKACELGVFSIAPLLSERSIVRLPPERWQAKLKRWRKIAVESCKQCGQNAPPLIQEVKVYGFFLSESVDQDLVLIPTLAVRGVGLYDAIRKQPARRVLALIGPEGDFTKKEVEAALSKGAQPIDLGPLVMRSETAAIYVLSALHFCYQNIYVD